MRKSFLCFLAVFTLIMVTGCGGGGGGKSASNGDTPNTTTFSVRITDSGVGFYEAGQTNFALLYIDTDDRIFKADAVRPITSSDIGSDHGAAFAYSLGVPKYVNKNGVGIYDVRVTQGAAGKWKASDYYDVWKVNGHQYLIGYGPKEAKYPGWSIWNMDSVTMVGPLAGTTIDISTYFVKSGSVASKVVEDKQRMAAQIAAIKAQY